MNRPAYKDDPLWRDAMALVEDAYALAGSAKTTSAAAAQRLRKVAVAIPSSIADALADEPEHPIAEDRSRALGALAEIERQTLALPPELSQAGDALAIRARVLYREVERRLAEAKEYS